jgi:hypothetical protein
MARNDLYRARKLYKHSARTRSPTAVKTWLIFFVLLLFWSGLAAIVWQVGYDFMAESGLRKLKVCGFARHVLPTGVGQGIPCLWWNLAPFYVMPAVVLLIAMKRTLTRS